MKARAQEIKKIMRRVIDIAYKYKASHLGSSLCAVNCLYDNFNIYDRIILSAGHAGLGFYCLLEYYFGIDAEKLFKKHGVHPNRDTDNMIYASSGSLGHGLGIAIGMAFANPKLKIAVYITDGEKSEGSIAEALRIIDKYNISNIKIIYGFNGYSALEKTALFNKEAVKYYSKISCLKGLEGHYHILNEEDYKKATKILS